VVQPSIRVASPGCGVITRKASPSTGPTGNQFRALASAITGKCAFRHSLTASCFSSPGTPSATNPGPITTALVLAGMAHPARHGCTITLCNWDATGT
jgi:hypothetical protein